MSSSINAAKLFQISMNYDRHRLKINSIKSRSASTLRKQSQQNSILSSRKAHKEYNSKFKNRQSLTQINKRNNKILEKLQTLSRVNRPNSTTSDSLRNSIVFNRQKSKQELNRNIDIENQRFLKKLFSVKSTINNSKQNSSYYDHKNRSQMISKFKKNQKGFTVPKTQLIIQRRVKLQPIHKKLQLVQSNVKQVRKVKVNESPIKFSTMKLRINPQKF